MPQFSRVSIIPIEMFTRPNCLIVEERLKYENIIQFPSKNRPMLSILQEISPLATTLHAINIPSSNAWTIFCGTSLCIVIDEQRSYDVLDETFIISELSARASYHARLIKEGTEPITKLILTVVRKAITDSIFPVEINYVFSSYVIFGREPLDKKCKSLLKTLAEPSILDMDDMLASARYNRTFGKFPSPEHRLFEKIRDIDPSSSATTYITWAGLVSYSINADTYIRTKDLIVCLEARLQTTWNSCFMFSRYADRVFDRRTKVKDFDTIYWSFVRILDDAKSVISSTLSSRAKELFHEMIKTSRLEGEIARLEIKLGLVDKFIALEERRRNVIYQKTIETLIFIAALSSIMQVLFSLPLIQDERIAWGVVATITIMGIVAILRSR